MVHNVLVSREREKALRRMITCLYSTMPEFAVNSSCVIFSTYAKIIVMFFSSMCTLFVHLQSSSYFPTRKKRKK